MPTSTETPAEETEKLTYLQKVWRYRRYLVVEPFVFFYVMASVFNTVAMQNFPLEKACRVNLMYNEVVCAKMLDKGDLDCDVFNFENTTTEAGGQGASLTDSSPLFNYTVCKAEVETQQLSAEVSGTRAPIAAIFPLIVLLFAGSWSDRYNKRKPCLIVPIIGEMLSFACLLISAIFFDEIGMEFGAYCEAIIPNLFGGFTFALMAIYSYITIITPEPDRLFRFGIFAMFVTGVPFIGQPISGYLFTQLGYKGSFAMAMIFQVIAILYIVFFIAEVKPQPKTESRSSEDDPPPLPTHGPPPLNGADNLAYETSNGTDETPTNKNVSFEMTPRSQATVKHEPPQGDVVPVKKSFLREFFDPTLVTDCLRFPFVKRKNRGRLLLNLLIFAYFLTIGPASGENDYWYRYTLKKLNWNGNDYSIYLTISSGLAMLGTFIGTAILSKWLKVSDPVVGILSALSVVISRVLFAFSRDTTSFYIAACVEMFVSLRVIAIKTIGSSIVDGEELSKMFSIFGISEPIAQFIFPPIVSYVYSKTVQSFPGAIFLFVEIFYIPNVLVFVLCYFILRRIRNKKKKAEANGAGKDGSATNGSANPDCEITSL